MKSIKKQKILFASGLLCTSAALVINNFNLSHFASGVLLGLGCVLTVYGYTSMKKNKPAC